MTKILFIGDIHGKRTNPLNRLCDYNEDQYKKLEWIRDYCMSNDVRTIVHLGDIFDKPEATEEWKNKFIQIWKPYQSFGKFYSIVGKLHDLFYNVEQSYPKTCLANLELSGILEVIDSKIIAVDNVELCALSMHTTTAKKQMLELDKSFRVGYEHIILAHQFYQWELEPEAGFTEEELKTIQTKCSLVLGHDHRQHQTQEVDMVSVFRPGSLMRTELSEETIQMKPRVLLYDNGSWNYIEVPHRDITEIYNVQEYRTKKANSKLFRQLENNLEDIGKYFHNNDTVIPCSQALKELNCPQEEYEYLKAVYQVCSQEF